MCQITIDPIAIIHTPFKEKFAIPRQPGLASEAKGHIVFRADYSSADFVRGLDQFSHIWLMFQFHQTAKPSHPPLVRPPRLGGNKKIGVFASRSTHRPNNLGMSVVKLDSVTLEDNAVSLLVSGVDLLDGTPIIDIKPYIPYSDAIPEAMAGYAQQAPRAHLHVQFEESAKSQLIEQKTKQPDLELLIRQVLAQDPRPAYHQQKTSDRVYGVSLYDLNIQWRVEDDQCIVTNISG